MISAVQSRLIDAQLAPAALGTAISTALAAKSLDAERQAGAAVLQLLEDTQTLAAAVAPSPTGQHLDIQA
jgi:hypothetical protein